MSHKTTKLGEAGRVVLPAEYRRALDLEPGAELVLTLVQDEIRITARKSALSRAQALVRRHVPAGDSLVDALIEERHGEVDRGG